MNTCRHFFGGVALTLALAGHTYAQDDAAPRRVAPWPAEVVELASHIAVQDGGRIKPLSTAAHWMLTRINGRSSCTVEIPGRSGKQKLSAVEWMLDCMFFPEQAEQYPIVLVQNTEALDAIGLKDLAKEKRERFSFAQLAPGRSQLGQLARRYADLDAKQRDGVQNQILDLSRSYADYAALLYYTSPFRVRYPVDGSQRLTTLFGGEKDAPLSAVLAKLPQIDALQRELAADGAAGAAEERAAVERLTRLVDQASRMSYGLAVFPPADPGMSEWWTPSDLVQFALHGHSNVGDAAPLLARLERMAAAPDDVAGFTEALRGLQTGLAERAQARGEYGKVGLEVTYYELDLFYRALLVYGVGFLLVIGSWLWPRSRWLPKAIWGLALVATAMVVVDIVLRCILRGRPPVSTIYETIPFITVVGVCTCFVIERINRKRVALPLAVFLGMGGMFLALAYSWADKQDTMPSLVAVLDTNFWLSTHVTSVVAGYSAGLLAAFIGHVYVLGRMLGVRRGDDAFYRNIARMTYGAICFGVVFSVVGTILGGIWANYSWGRFWGWDPKENGALMIVLWELAMLHGRLGGYIRDFGFCMATIFGAMVIAFSWWGVNVMGVGLHSYGFTSGIAIALNAFYVFEAAVLIAGGTYWLVTRRRAAAAG